MEACWFGRASHVPEAGGPAGQLQATAGPALVIILHTPSSGGGVGCR